MHCSYIMAFTKLKILTAIWAFTRILIIIEPFLISLCSQSTFMILQPQSHSAIWWKQQMQNPESLMIESYFLRWCFHSICYCHKLFQVFYCSLYVLTTPWPFLIDLRGNNQLGPSPELVDANSLSDDPKPGALMRSLVLDHKVIKKWP